MHSIRRAGIDDVELIRSLAHDTWPDAYGKILSPQQITYMLELMYSNKALTDQMLSGHDFIIVYEDEKPVGFAGFSAKNKDERSLFRLHKLYVLPSQQGKGTGKFLLNEVIRLSRASGAMALELNVNRHNKALHFYKKIGFQITREEDIDIGEGYFMNDYVMLLELRS